MSENKCPLSSVPVGTICKIKGIECPSEECVLRILEMGFCENREIQVLKSDHHLICRVCQSRLGVAKKIADVIMVEPLDKPE